MEHLFGTWELALYTVTALGGDVPMGTTDRGTLHRDGVQRGDL
ncbi:MAG: hypothetical protein ACFB51_05635 [Anaerolineae bacterium]